MLGTKEDLIRTHVRMRTRKDPGVRCGLVRWRHQPTGLDGPLSERPHVYSGHARGRRGDVRGFRTADDHYIRFLGNRGLSDKALLKITGLKTGDPMNRFAVEEARRKIEELYQSKGFPKTEVLIQEGDQPRDRGAVFAINEGNLERILDVSSSATRSPPARGSRRRSGPSRVGST
jgi:hemolysin activation/secretion protein